MEEGLVATPACAACGSPSAYVELVPPGHLPAEWAWWSSQDREAFQHHRDPGQWYLLFEGVAPGNRLGDAITPAKAASIADAFRKPYCYARVHRAGFYDDAGYCKQCDAAYCYRHWHVSVTGFGHCPQGHGKSLDPHWWSKLPWG